jgi:hypothetical protein
MVDDEVALVNKETIGNMRYNVSKPKMKIDDPDDELDEALINNDAVSMISSCF